MKLKNTMELLCVIERRIKNFYPNAFNFSLSVSNKNNSVYLHFQCSEFISLQFVKKIIIDTFGTGRYKFDNYKLASDIWTFITKKSISNVFLVKSYVLCSK